MDDKQIVIIFSEEIEKEYEERKKNAIERSQERYLSSAIGKLQSS